MSWFGRLWYLAAAVGLLVAVGVMLGAVYGKPDVSVTDVEIEGTTPNVTAECPSKIVRQVDVSITLSRGGLSPDHPQWWEIGLQVRSTVFDAAKDRSVSLAPGETVTVTMPFTSVRKQSWAPSERVTAVVQVTQTHHVLAQRTVSTGLRPVNRDRDC